MDNFYILMKYPEHIIKERLRLHIYDLVQNCKQIEIIKIEDQGDTVTLTTEYLSTYIRHISVIIDTEQLMWRKIDKQIAGNLKLNFKFTMEVTNDFIPS